MQHLKMLTLPDLRTMGLDMPGFRCAFMGGSRAIVDPPPTDTDCDIVVHVSEVERAAYFLHNNGADITCGEYLNDGSDFTTLRKGVFNLMLLSDAYEFGALMGATSYAKSVNMKVKADRYAFFTGVRLPWRSRV